MMYEFVTLSPEQLVTRRHALDQAGQLAWLSPIILLMTAYAYRRLLKPSLSSIPSSPPTTQESAVSPLRKTIRRVQWSLNSTIIPEFGSLHVQVIGIIYLTWLLYIIIKGTGNDYMHLTKSFGHVAISQLPMHYLLGFKHPNSPITLATGLTHERLNAYHRLFGRIIHGLLACHAVLYLNFFVAIGVLQKRINSWDVRYGLLAFSAVNILGFLAIPPVRAARYHSVFYRSHVVLPALIVVLLFLHVPYTRVYVAQAGVFWVVNGWMRARSSHTVVVHVEKIGQQLLNIKIQADQIQMVDWVQGMHVYLKREGLSMGPKTPFTIVHVAESNEKDKVEVQLVVRDLNGPMTGWLAAAGNSKKPERMLLEGPYGEARESLPDLLAAGKNTGRILLVAGGVGATYTLPIYVALVNARGSSAGVSLVWLVKDAAEAAWGVDLLSQIEFDVDASIHVTNTQKQTELSKNSPRSTSQKNGLSFEEAGRRPDLQKIVDGVFLSKNSAKAGERATVFVCGPPGLSQDLRTAVGKHVGHGREVVWYEEQFGFGGS